MDALKVVRLIWYAGEDGKFSFTATDGHHLRECIERVGVHWYYSKSYIHPRNPINENDLPKEIELYLFLLGEDNG